MATSYDYVQIVVDNDWGLVGIVPPGGAGDRVKKMSLISSSPTETETEDLPEIGLTEKVVLAREPRRNPVTRIITRHESQVTPAETSRRSTESRESVTKMNPNVLTGITADHISSRPALTAAYEQFPEMFGNISSRATVGARENLLVGFGR